MLARSRAHLHVLYQPLLTRERNIQLTCAVAASGVVPLVIIQKLSSLSQGLVKPGVDLTFWHKPSLRMHKLCVCVHART